MMTLAYVFAVVVLTVALVGGHQLFWRWYYTAPGFPMSGTSSRRRMAGASPWPACGRRPRGPARGEPVVCFPGLACNGPHLRLRRRAQPGPPPGGSRLRCVDRRSPKGTGASARRLLQARLWWVSRLRRSRRAGRRAACPGVTGHTQVLWVGHSMGGLVGYRRRPPPRLGDCLAGVVALGNPADFSPHRSALGPLHTFFVLDRFLRGWPVVRLGRLCNLLAPLAGRCGPGPRRSSCSRPPPPRMLRHFMVEVVEDVPRQLLDEFADNVVRAIGFDGRPARDGQAALAASAVPVLASPALMTASAPAALGGGGRAPGGLRGRDGVLVGHDEGMGSALDLVVRGGGPRVIYPRVAVAAGEALDALQILRRGAGRPGRRERRLDARLTGPEQGLGPRQVDGGQLLARIAGLDRRRQQRRRLAQLLPARATSTRPRLAWADQAEAAAPGWIAAAPRPPSSPSFCSLLARFSSMRRRSSGGASLKASRNRLRAAAWLPDAAAATARVSAMRCLRPNRRMSH
ncbi:MAG: hypothetical protein R3F43_21400 [bacterium]